MCALQALLVSATVAFITLSVRGVSVAEVTQLLSCEDDVLAETYQVRANSNSSVSDASYQPLTN